MIKRTGFLLAALLLVPIAAGAVTEEKTGVSYPDTITVEVGAGEVTLVATGVALREKTFLKVDVYTICSWVDASLDLTGDPARGVLEADLPKRLQMDLRRGFSRQKLVDAFVESIEKNHEDTGPFAADMDTFLAYFDRDAEEGDRIVFDYAPGTGLTTRLNGAVKGVIANPAFAEALWSAWFGRKPVSGDMKKDLVAAVD